MRTRRGVYPWPLGAAVLLLSLGVACRPRYAREPLPPCHGRVLAQGWRLLADSLPGADTIRGRVIDAARWHPLAGVAVSLVGTARGVQTDTHGAFTLPVTPVAPSGRVVLRISRIGYAALMDTVTLDPGRGRRLHVWLDPEGGRGCPSSWLLRRKRWWEWS